MAHFVWLQQVSNYYEGIEKSLRSISKVSMRVSVLCRIIYAWVEMYIEHGHNPLGTKLNVTVNVFNEPKPTSQEVREIN